LVLAGPGTGKTTTMVEAIAARVDAGTDPGRVLTLTFSRRAASELRARIGQRLRRTVAAPLASTFHGFGFSLVAEQLAPDDLGRGQRVLAGPEQEVVVRELLAHDREIGRVAWPDELTAALRTRGFTEQVRTFMSTARSLGLGAREVASLAPERADWVAASTFMSDYLDVMDSRGLLDYSELVTRAVAYAQSDHGRAALRGRYDLVVVDEYQDTDPAQEMLLQAIAGDGRDIVAVGDPDQSIYGFRGADVRGITEFSDRFRSRTGAPAEILTLSTSRRCAESIVVSSRRVAALLGPAGSLPIESLRSHRDLVVPDNHHAGSVEVRCFPTAEREASAIAELLRREHLHARTPWSQMAVLVRSGMTSIPALQRALSMSGVPVEIAVDEIPLRDHPTTAPLLALLEYAVRPESLSADCVHELMLSPLVDASPSQLRRLGRALRQRARDDGSLDPQSSPELVREAALEPEMVRGLPTAVARPLLRLAELLHDAQAAKQHGQSAHELLWTVWSRSSWSGRLIRQAQSGSQRRGVDANRSLDAVVALFELAERSRDRSPRTDLDTFLAEVLAQEIPAGPLADTGTAGDGVRVMTAHRSKGLEWDVVVVASVQADAWPDVRRRGSVLEPDMLGHDSVRTPSTVADLRRDERRLFYVAVTRARRRLVCTAVEAPTDDGQRPSPFLDDLGVEIVSESATPTDPLTLAGLVAQLRRVVIDPDETEVLRSAAAERLARLADETTASGEPVVAAHPDRWWGRREFSGPLPDPAQGEIAETPPVLHLSGSQLEALQRCPLQWYLSRRVRAESQRSTNASFGGLVHALADGVARGEVAPQLDELVSVLDDVWAQLPFPAAWEASQEHALAVEALQRFLHWHADVRDRTIVSTEQEFCSTFTVSGQTVELRGRVDRLEVETAEVNEGGDRLVVVDFKTSRSARTAHEVATDLQLATYRRLVAEEHEVAASDVDAELVQLRHPAGKGRPDPKVQVHRPSEEADQSLEATLEQAVATVRSGQFPATPGKACNYCQFTLTCPAQPAGQEVLP
jgi:superfamily I DNA/RNA helicase/RecB family exonuclease